MKLKLNRKSAAVLLNLASFAGFTIFSLIGVSQANKQEYNYAAERWGSGYSQISCFMPESAGFTTDSLDSIRAGMLSALQEASITQEEGQRLCPDAYSTPTGQATVKSDINGSSEAEITAVGGDFFMIHNFKLIDGAFFTDDDLMQDGAVIDEELAWALYGSSEVSGMNITINGTQFYISGVIETPQSKDEQKCAGDLPRAYISYDGASGFSSDSSDTLETVSDSDDEQVLKKITCYEVLMPDPVEDYAYSSVSELMESYGDDVIMVQNSGRFGAFKRLSAIKKLSLSVVWDNETVLPYWENASRITEYRLSFIYLGAAVCLAAPAVTLILLIIKGAVIYKRKNISGNIKSFFSQIAEKIRTRKYNK